MRLMILGGTGRGKTTTLNSLQGRPFVPEHISTRGIDLSIYYLLTGSHHLSREDAQRMIKSQSYEGMIARLRTSGYSDEIVSQSEACSLRTTQVKETRTDCHSIQQAKSAGLNRIRDQAYEQAHNFWNKRSIIMNCDGTVLRCWGFGGDAEREISHELFISPRCLLMFVFDFESICSRRETSERDRRAGSVDVDGLLGCSRP